MTERVVKSIKYHHKVWDIVKVNGSYFARYDKSDTGPYSSVVEAEEFIRNIQQ
ncbi:MAG TPA: hypothetical protein VHK86_00760 [Nitrososphaera sp.]|jgi:hypothetical protein|nr:hypothetical protein [Nitrososphaera sp.]